MLRHLAGRAGTEHQPRQDSAPKRRSVAFVELITTAALALSTAVAITAVSIGMARADVAGVVAKGDSTPFAVALFISLLLFGMGSVTAILAADHTRQNPVG